MPAIHPPESLSDGVVLLRPFTRGDVSAIARNCSDPEVPRRTRVPSPYTEAHADLFLDRLDVGLARGEMVSLAVCEVRERAALGAITIQRFEWEHRRGEIGYYLGAAGRGRGLMSRAVRVITPWAFAKLGLARLEILASTDNPASQRVAERAGYVREGVLRSFWELRG
ncbi:MAG TPA: GNAT family N-acetyltransferase, partial [Solirubrobacteraceae bacterium]